MRSVVRRLNVFAPAAEAALLAQRSRVPEGAWKHDRADADLFAKESKPERVMVNPHFWNVRSMERPAPNPSLLPFGPSFSAPPPAPAPVANNPTALQDRIGIKGAAAKSAAAALPAGSLRSGAPMRAEAPAFSLAEERAKKEAQDKKLADMAARKKYAEAKKAFEQGPTDVRVSNLADGTSDDDVQVSFPSITSGYSRG